MGLVQGPALNRGPKRDGAVTAGTQGRSLPAEEVLPLLRKQEPKLCCQYLEYLVMGRGSQVPEHHTELALSFASAALELMPSVNDRCALIDLSPSAWCGRPITIPEPFPT